MKRFNLLILVVALFFLVGCNKTVTVTFLGVNNEIIEVLEMEKNSEINYPKAPVIDGYDFLFWDTDVLYAIEDVVISAVYEIHTFTVKFYDFSNKLISEQIIEYGHSAEAPTLELIDNYVFLGWDKDYSSIKEDLKIYPLYQKEYYEVSFLDINGNIINTQKVKSGQDALAPEVPVIDYYVFVGWDKEFTNVNKDIKVNAVYESIGDYEMNDANYWLKLLSKKYNINEIILSSKEIEEYNENILLGYNSTHVVDVTKLSKTISATDLKNLINSYDNMNKYEVYDTNTNSILSAAEKQNILNNRNIDAISSTVDVIFGIVTEFAWLRSFPTNHYSSSYSRDRFQETSLNVGEGVAIYHYSADDEWYFIQAQNYYGWVEKKNIAVCSYEEMNKFLNPSDFIVVINDYVLIDDVYVRMGQALPIIDKNDTAYQISFPKRNDDGSIYFINPYIEINDDNYSYGYLEYNYKNLFNQAFKLLGINYSWGDKEKAGRDCSSTQNAIYSCFGFMMPRNTSEQLSIPTYGVKVNGVSSALMKQKYLPGTLIFSSGHVMMYIGEDENGTSYLFHNTSAGDGKCILQPLDNYGGYKIIATLMLYNE